VSLAPGTRLGPYEILSLVGIGGMGEVYKARDIRLDRMVAVKVLAGEFSMDGDRRLRFEREARVVAGLNHPHICTLHDIGQHEGMVFLVMEYLEGDTLGERLKRGPLPFDGLLKHAIEITEALEGAHRAGVIHRDLKPSNIVLTGSGAKLLDFGLAKLKAPWPAQSGATLTAPPIEEKALTLEGTILGTLQYMAPEQLEAKEPDARTDPVGLGLRAP